MKNRRRFTITLGAVLMVCMLATGYAAVAAEYASNNGPLITQNYRELVLMPIPVSETQHTINFESVRKQSALEKKIIESSRAFDGKMAALAAKFLQTSAFIHPISQAGGAVQEEEWLTVMVSPGQVLKLDINTEVILQKGSATCVESAGTGLIGLSGGGVLSAQEALATELRYAATTQGAGLRATSAATVLVCGGHTLA